MKKKMRNIVLVAIVCGLVAVQIYLMPKIAPLSSNPPTQPEPQATILVYPLPSTMNVQSNFMILQALLKEKTPSKSENTEGVDSIKRQ